MWIPANFYIQKGKTLSAEIKCGSELWGKSERKETEERLNHKLNFNHRCLAAAGKVRAITRGGEHGHVCPSPWRWDPIQSAVADNLVLHIEVAVDQLEEHQRRAQKHDLWRRVGETGVAGAAWAGEKWNPSLSTQVSQELSWYSGFFQGTQKALSELAASKASLANSFGLDALVT